MATVIQPSHITVLYSWYESGLNGRDYLCIVGEVTVSEAGLITANALGMEKVLFGSTGSNVADNAQLAFVPAYDFDGLRVIFSTQPAGKYRFTAKGFPNA